jgi:hypothetical protein
LLEGPARFNALMLARVTDQKHTILGTKARKKLPHLVGAGNAGFVNKEESLLLWIMLAISSACEKTL